MAVTHPTAVRDGLCNFVVDQLDGGTPPGTLVFQTAGSGTVTGTGVFTLKGNRLELDPRTIEHRNL